MNSAAPGYRKIDGATIIHVARKHNQLRIDLWGGQCLAIEDDGSTLVDDHVTTTIQMNFSADAVAADGETLLRLWLDQNQAVSVESNGKDSVLIKNAATGQKVGSGPSY